MKKVVIISACLSLVLLGAGCQNRKTKAVEGAVIGGVVGAAAGGIIGHQMHRGAEGAGIGAAVGAVAGGLIGGQMENKPAGAENPKQMSQQEVVDLTKQGLSEGAIIEKIKASNSQFSLSDADISYLKKEGVSQKVIDAMQGKS